MQSEYKNIVRKWNAKNLAERLEVLALLFPVACFLISIACYILLLTIK